MNKIDKIIDIFNEMKDGKEILSEKIDTYTEYIGFSIGKDAFYRKWTDTGIEVPEIKYMTFNETFWFMRSFLEKLENESDK